MTLGGLVGLHAGLRRHIGARPACAARLQVVQNTMSEFDADGDSKLSFEEFVQLLSSTDLQNKFSLAM